MCVCRAASLNLPPCRSNVGLQEDGGEGRLVVSLFDDWIERWQQRQAAKARAGGSGGKPVAPRLFTVGRLDVQSVGLIFVTNDGDWAHRWVAGQAGGRLCTSLHCQHQNLFCTASCILVSALCSRGQSLSNQPQCVLPR